MVSPASKNNASILSAMAIDADHVSLSSSGSIFESDPFYFGTGQYVAARDAQSGWRLAFSPVDPNSFLADHLAGDDRIFESFAPLLPGEPNDGGTDVYRWTAGTLTLVSTSSTGATGPFDADYIASSKGGGHLLFKTAEELDARDTGREPGASMLYERVGGETRAVGLDSAGQPLGTSGAILAGDGPGALTPVGEGGVSHPISEDGSRIFFESPDPILAGNTQLYVREHGQETTLVSAPQRSMPDDGSFPARFEGAAADGSRVLFRTRSQLVDGDEDAYADLYSYDVGTGQLTRVSAGQANAESGICPADGADGLRGVCGVVAVSEDAQRVYYLSTGALPSGGVAGRLNIYLYDGQSGQTSTVASVPNDINGTIDWTVSGLYQAGLERALPRAETTPDGSVLAFVADSSLTTFDSTGPNCSPDTQGRCVQVYRFDASTHMTDCVSCNGEERPPLGSADVPVTAAVPRPARRFLSPDGSTVAFETSDPLVPEDHDEQVDVYEWAGGQPTLVSSGEDPRRSTLVGYGPDAHDLFFLTPIPLIPQDTDALTDLYDARVGGGLPGPPTPPGPCEEGSCEPAPSAPPSVAAPVSLGPGVRGNVTRGARGRVEVVGIEPLGRSETRRIRVTLRTTTRGRVSIAVSARLGGRSRTIARRSRQVRRATTLKLDVALSARALRVLRRDRRLTLVVSAQLTTAPRWDRRTIMLKGPSKR